MRVTKFRGKLAEMSLPRNKGDWVYGDLVWIQDVSVKPRAYIYGFGRVTETSIGEFTGLCDADGKEIYEGDIVSIPREDFPFEIKWDDDLARFIIFSEIEELIYDFDNWHGKELRVIGNIYENPDLLEATK